MIQPIDFVIAWVDGNAPVLLQKRQQYLNEDIAQNAVSNTRFASNDEIYFCIASILKYVPYSGKIYLITDQQAPKWIDEFEKQGLCEKDKIKIVDHKELFVGFEEFLPTFNSLSIESMLWNIQNLSDQFIYLNDDFFFNHASLVSDFIDDEKIVIYGHWQSNFSKKIKYLIRKYMKVHWKKSISPKYTTAQMLSADMVGLNRYYEIHHRPHILSRKVLKDYFDVNIDILKQQISFKFRDIQQFLPVGLNNHLLIQKNCALLRKDTEIAYLKSVNELDTFFIQLKNQNIKFGCIQSLDSFDDVSIQKIYVELIGKFKSHLPTQIKRISE